VRVKVGREPLAVTVRALDRAFLDARLAPAQIVSREMVRDALDEHFAAVDTIARMIALAAALVGAIVLAATTSLNVLERQREIGVLRTLGATPRGVAGIFVAEGLMIAALGLVLAIALSLPLTLAALDAAAHNLLYVSVPLQFSSAGLALLCAGAVPVVATVVIAVWIGMRAAVRENLAAG